MTSIAQQDVAQLGGRISVLARQKRDHIALDRLLQRLPVIPGPEQDRVLLDVYRLVFPHAFAEEALLWPAIRRALPDDGELTLDVELEHQEVNELVTRLEGLGPGDPARMELLARLVQVLRDDVRDEEDVLLPRLQAALDRRELRRLGVLWELVRRIAPTRAHPVVARRPPGNVLAALPLSVVDRLRDGLQVAELGGPGRLVPGLRAAGRVLAAVSHQIERVPLLRIGEDPATSARHRRAAARRGG